jgi:cationic amino acid transporter 14
VDTGPATEESGMFVMKMVGLLYLLILIFDLIVVCSMGSPSGATTFFLMLFLLAIVAVLLVISRKPQNRWVSRYSYRFPRRFVMLLSSQRPN